MQYVAQDVRTTLDLATACKACGTFHWIARSGKLRSMAQPEEWLTVEAAQDIALPDMSWMDEPWSRATFTEWMR